MSSSSSSFCFVDHVPPPPPHPKKKKKKRTENFDNQCSLKALASAKTISFCARFNHGFTREQIFSYISKSACIDLLQV